MRFNYRIIAFVLTLTMLLTMNLFPITALDDSTSETLDSNINVVTPNEEDALVNVSDTSQTDEVFIIAEDTTKRTEFEKHFFCSDGTFTVVTYPEAVHYLDDNGKWVDIDNSFETNSNSSVYTARSGNFNASFSKKPNENSKSRIVSLESKEHAISWALGINKKNTVSAQVQNYAQSSSNEERNQNKSIKGEARVHGKFKSNKKNDSGSLFANKNVNDKDAYILPNVYNVVEYDSLFGENEGISVKYTIFHNKVEEDIIIEKKTDIESFSMTVECGNLTPVLNEDNSVDLLDKNGKSVYHISTPYMVDAAFAVLNDIEVTLATSGSSCIITYTPNSAWFTSNDREYPIMLDPSITTSEYEGVIADTYVKRSDNGDHSSEQHLYIDKSGTYERATVIYIEGLPNIDPTMPIYHAELGFHLGSGQSSACDVVFESVVPPASSNEAVMAEHYTINNITYQKLLKATRTVVDESSIAAGSTSIAFNISQCIDEIFSGDLHIFALSLAQGSTGAVCAPIYSTEYTNASLRPYLTLRYGYSLPEDLSDGQTISLQNYAHEGFLYTSSSINNNAVVKSCAVGSLTSNYKFILRKNSSTGGYALESAASSSAARLTVGVTDVEDNVSVYASGTADPEGFNAYAQQEWLIVPESYSEFRIVLRSDMSMALTAISPSTDGGSDMSITSPGNVIVKSLYLSDWGDSSDLGQEWTIYKNGAIIDPDSPFDDLATGTYYFYNSSTTKFICPNGTAVIGQGAADISNFSVENNAAWYITNLGNNMYTIQSEYDRSKFLTLKNSGTVTTLATYSGSASAEIPDKLIWNLYWDSNQAGYTIINKLYSTRIYSSGTTVAAQSTTSTDAQYLWRIEAICNYNPVSETNIKFKDIAVDIGEPSYPKIWKIEAVDFASVSDFTYSVVSGSSYVSVDHNTGVITGNKVGTAEIKATYKYNTSIYFNFNVKVNKNAIIIVPGIMGTILKAGTNNTKIEPGTTLWDDSLVTLNELEIFNRLLSLKCDSDGISENDIVPYNNLYGAGDEYKEIYTFLDNHYSNTHEICFFAYDWRLSNSTSADYLNDFINSNEFDKVVLICHSMGGLVASAYLALGEEKQLKTDAVIMLGSPLLGTPVIPYLWGSEDLNVIGLLDKMGLSDWKISIFEAITTKYNPIDYFIGNFQSLYELFPNESYFSQTYANRHYLSTSILGMDPINITSFGETQNRLQSYLPHYNLSLGNNAQAFHSALIINGEHCTNLVNTYYVASYGFDTIEIIHFNMDSWSINSETGCGDSVVPYWSATLGDRYSSKTFFANQLDHMNLIKDSQILAFVNDLIQDKISTASYSKIIDNMP